MLRTGEHHNITINKCSERDSCSKTKMFLAPLCGTSSNPNTILGNNITINKCSERDSNPCPRIENPR